MTQLQHVGLREFSDEFAAHFRPSGSRLGVAVLRDAPVAVSDPIDAVVLQAGFTPARRVARLGPRYGEEHMRAPDIADFVMRYGHEYVAVVLPDTISELADRQLIEQACIASGCALWWYNERR